MDAMPGYVRFDTSKKLMCKIQVLGTDDSASEQASHTHEVTPDPKSPIMADEFQAKAQLAASGGTNQSKVTVTGTENIIVKVKEGETLDNISVTGHSEWGSEKWVAIDFNTGEDTIVGMEYINRGTTTVLTENDVAEAEAIGLGAGHLAVWVKVDKAAETPATFTLVSGKKSIDVTITGVLA